MKRKVIVPFKGHGGPRKNTRRGTKVGSAQTHLQPSGQNTAGNHVVFPDGNGAIAVRSFSFDEKTDGKHP
jgi:hypothetical protein